MLAKPLEGIRILDLTHMLSGPYGAMILADMGADVIKVEPLAGEGTRKLLATDPNNSLNGMGAYFITLNRNKRSVCIDLKSDEGRALFYELVGESDVVIDNFGAGVPERLGIALEDLKEHNPGVITCSITGYGSDGPNYKRPAFDQVAQATGGGMSITGRSKDEPQRAGIPIGDLAGGMFAVMGILAAIRERDQSGQGQHVDISMLDCQVSMLSYMATMFFLSGENPEPIGNGHFVHVPYNTYPTKDGHLVIAVITDNFWHNLKAVVRETAPCPEFDADKYDTQPGRLEDKDFIDTRLAEIFAEETTEHWLKLLNHYRIPCAPVNNFAQAFADEQIKYRNMIVELQHPDGGSTFGPGNPIKLSRSGAEEFSPAPLLGADTYDVLSRLLNKSTAEIESLRQSKVVS